MEKKITTDSVAQTHAVAEQFIAQNTHRIVAFYGDLGSGKTTAVRTARTHRRHLRSSKNTRIVTATISIPFITLMHIA